MIAELAAGSLSQAVALLEEEKLERRRHLLRLWLSVRNGQPLPPFLAERWGSIEPGTLRGGIIVPGAKLNAPLDAV